MRECKHLTPVPGWSKAIQAPKPVNPAWLHSGCVTWFVWGTDNITTSGAGVWDMAFRFGVPFYPVNMSDTELTEGNGWELDYLMDD